ncbi:ArsR/SmtB family transcription factor [Paenibacillus hamazuiensis]|uniref:ArsR/SmtB family transcription factor n=1 Tax=Paenibacillus hamazuiensis TaxID=2936508 RepID=UPI00200DD240|nr:helix-turn-helix domain-containing protein [Paenibacillus hamazuiensis]
MTQTNESTKKISASQLLEVAKALSSELRLRILEAVSERPMSVTELSKHLGVAQPTVTLNIQMLEAAGLIESEQKLGKGKICSRSSDYLLLELPSVPIDIAEHLQTMEMPVGMFTDFLVKAPCGLVGREGLIGYADDPRTFYLPERADAQLVWFSEDGFLEYRFPSLLPAQSGFSSISISAEICSEYLGYNDDWLSDITLFVNGLEIGTYTSPGDFGSSKGALTPGWWYGGTQYGSLTEWTIGPTGSQLNGERISDVCLEHLQLSEQKPIVIRFEVKADAAHRGGLNIFGADFGNAAQAIRLSFIR